MAQAGGPVRRCRVETMRLMPRRVATRGFARVRGTGRSAVRFVTHERRAAPSCRSLSPPTRARRSGGLHQCVAWRRWQAGGAGFRSQPVRRPFAWQLIQASCIRTRHPRVVCVKFCKAVLADLIFLASGQFFCSAPAEPFFRPGHASMSPSRTGAVKDGRGALGPVRATGQRSVSRSRSSNRTCRFPASGSPTGFTSRPAACP
jgi:hypothetical protein